MSIPWNRPALHVPALHVTTALLWSVVGLSLSLTALAQGVKEPQTLQWDSPGVDDVLRLSVPVPLVATVSSGRPVIFEVEHGPAFIDGDQVIATNLGTIRLAAKEPGDDRFAPVYSRRTFNLSSIQGTALATVDTPSSAGAVLVQDGLAYVADGTSLIILDVADPAHPTTKGTLPALGSIQHLALQGTQLLLAEGAAGMQWVDVSQPANPVRIGSFLGTGSSRRVTWLGNIACVGQHPARLDLVDISASTNGALLGSVSLSHSVVSLVTAGNVVYQADNWSEFHVIDCANPQEPVLRSSSPPGTLAGRMAIRSGFVFATAGHTGLAVFDVQDPAHPVEISQAYLEEEAQQVAVQGDKAYVSLFRGRVAAVDVSDPAHPVLAGGFTASSFPYGLEVKGDIACVTMGSAGIQLFRLREGIAQAIEFRPPTVVTNPADGLTLAASSSSGLPVAFTVVSGPATLEGGHVNFSGVGLVVIRATQDGNVQFLPAVEERRITVGMPPTIDVQPAPTNVVSGTSVTLRVEASGPGPLAYKWYRNGVADGGTQAARTFTAQRATMGLYSVVVSNASGSVTSRLAAVTAGLPGAEFAVGFRGESANLGSHYAGSPARCQVRGDLAYVINGERAIVGVYDLSSPERPTKVAQTIIQTGQVPFGIALVDDTALVAERRNGLGLYDISDPPNIRRLRSFALPGLLGNDIVVRDRVAFIGNEDAGLVVVDVNDPRNPRVIGQSPLTAGTANGVFLEGDRVVVGCWSRAFQVFDITTLTQPRSIISYPASGVSYSGMSFAVAAAWPVVVVGQTAGGMVGYSLTNLAAPKQLPLGGGINWDFRLYGNHLLAADAASGFQMYALTNGNVPVSVGASSGLGSGFGVQLHGNRLLQLGSNLTLLDIVFPSKPPVATEPREWRRMKEGSSLTLHAAATGTEPFGYQWYHDGQAIGGAEGATLALASLAAKDAGEYSVMVTNLLGSALLPIAKLEILSLQPPRFLPESIRLGPDGRLHFKIAGERSGSAQLMSSSDLVHWRPWRLITLDPEGVEVIDDAPPTGNVFFRVQQAP